MEPKKTTPVFRNGEVIDLPDFELPEYKEVEDAEPHVLERYAPGSTTKDMEHHRHAFIEMDNRIAGILHQFTTDLEEIDEKVKPYTKENRETTVKEFLTKSLDELEETLREELEKVQKVAAQVEEWINSAYDATYGPNGKTSEIELLREEIRASDIRANLEGMEAAQLMEVLGKAVNHGKVGYQIIKAMENSPIMVLFPDVANYIKELKKVAALDRYPNLLARRRHAEDIRTAGLDRLDNIARAIDDKIDKVIGPHGEHRERKYGLIPMRYRYNRSRPKGMVAGDPTLR